MKKKKGKVLILVPPLNSKGGIANYYSVLESHFSSDIDYCLRGTRNQGIKGTWWIEACRFFSDLQKYIIHLKSGQYRLIHMNTSLSVQSILRDVLYIAFAYVYGIPCLPFFRGWSDRAEHEVERYISWIMRRTYFRSSDIVTLSTHSQGKLKEWGYEGKIHIETTVVDNSLLTSMSIDVVHSRESQNEFKILFLARVEIDKGIFELIEAVTRLSEKYKNMSLILAGTGSADEQVFQKIHHLSCVSRIGYVTGQAKIDAYLSASVYVLPSYREGMPNSLLEAMSFGLPVVCTGVGGIPDVIADMKNGVIIPSRDSNAIEKAIELLYLDRELCLKMAQENYESSTRFYASNVVKRLESIYDQIGNGKLRTS